MKDQENNPFQSPTEASPPGVSSKRFDVIRWRVRLAWIFPAVAVGLIGSGLAIHAQTNQPMHFALMIAIVCCMALGVVYSGYAMVMAWSMPEIQGHAAMGMIINVLLAVAVCGGIFG